MNNSICERKRAPHLGHDSIGITQLLPPPARNSADEVPSPNGNNAPLCKMLTITADFSERQREAYDNSTFWKVVHGHGERIFNSQREILQRTVMETVNRHRHYIDHEVAEKVKALKRLLSARELEHLKNAVRGESVVRGAKAYFDQFAGRILHFGLKEIDVHRYVMGYISLLAD